MAGATFHGSYRATRGASPALWFGSALLVSNHRIPFSVDRERSLDPQGVEAALATLEDTFSIELDD
jgi:hypothetical protein